MHGDFVTTGNATASTIDATFDGIDCDDGSGVWLPLTGCIRVTKSVTVRLQVAGTCESEDRCLRHRQYETRQELLFERFSLKRRFIRYQSQPYWCATCKTIFGVDSKPVKRGRPSKYGRSLLAYIFYHVIELFVPVQMVARSLSRLFGLDLSTGTMASFKNQMAAYYIETHQRILERVVSGNLVHADETNASIKGKRAYVWVFTNSLEKNRDKLFTFLQFDGVPWNNNNAEHAIKAFARLRDTIEGSSTEKGLREYLVLLSIC